jgi:hypothetical protein
MPKTVVAAIAATSAELATLLVSERRDIFRADGMVRPDLSNGDCIGTVEKALAEHTTARRAIVRSISAVTSHEKSNRNGNQRNATDLHRQ